MRRGARVWGWVSAANDLYNEAVRIPVDAEAGGDEDEAMRRFLTGRTGLTPVRYHDWQPLYDAAFAAGLIWYGFR